MQNKSNSRRSRGMGSLDSRRDSAGRETWYGRFYVGGRLVKRRLGVKRQAGERVGLTRPQAEAELRRVMVAASNTHAIRERERVELGEAGLRYLDHLATQGRVKRSTAEAYESILRIHLAPFFRGRGVDTISGPDLETYLSAKHQENKSAKTVRNHLALLHSIMEFAAKKGWRTTENPARLVDKPRIASERDIRFLDLDELAALLTAVDARADAWTPTERALYLTAAMTGLRQGELFGLRWRDVDWLAGRLRVRQSYVRGQFDTPKSSRSSRAVPLADDVAAELDRHHKRTPWPKDDDLVFPNPTSGEPLDKSKVLKRFKDALASAGVRPMRFHDLRHTFGTRMAAAGVPMRTLQEWMGHRDHQTTLVYAHYAPDRGERDLVQAAFTRADTTTEIAPVR